MSTRGLLIQTLIATVLWGLGMVLVFDWPRAEILTPMVFFAAVYWGIGRVIGLILAKRSQK